jgi:hypothetical protein
MAIKIITANLAGGDQKTHRTVEAAAQRIANPRNQPRHFGGIVLVSCSGVDESVIDDRVEEILADAAAGYYD